MRFKQFWKVLPHAPRPGRVAHLILESRAEGRGDVGSGGLASAQRGTLEVWNSHLEEGAGLLCPSSFSFMQAQERPLTGTRGGSKSLQPRASPPFCLSFAMCQDGAFLTFCRNQGETIC